MFNGFNAEQNSHQRWSLNVEIFSCLMLKKAETRMTASVLKQDLNTYNFKRTLFIRINTTCEFF